MEELLVYLQNSAEGQHPTGQAFSGAHVPQSPPGEAAHVECKLLELVGSASSKHVHQTEQRSWPDRSSKLKDPQLMTARQSQAALL